MTSTMIINELNRYKKVCFGTFIVGRMVPNFFYFEKESGVLGGSILLGALSKAWGYIENIDLGIYSTISADLCMSVAPDTENYSSRFTSSALDACSASANLVDYINGGPDELIAEIVTFSTDTIDLFIRMAMESRGVSGVTDSHVLAHPLMQREISLQTDDLAFLVSAPDAPAECLPKVLKRALANWRGSLVDEL